VRRRPLWFQLSCNMTCLTATLYKLTKRLAHILSLPLTLHHSLAPKLKRSNKHDPDSHKYDNVPPELAFLATCIIVLKMIYGLDGKTRYEHYFNDHIYILNALPGPPILGVTQHAHCPD
jgi:hypothetical protein